MIESKLRPKVVLWWGIGLVLAGMLLTTLLPSLAYGFMPTNVASTTLDQGLLTGLAYVVQLITQVIPPLGVTLIGAALVMAYVGRLLGARASENEENAAPVE